MYGLENEDEERLRSASQGYKEAWEKTECVIDDLCDPGGSLPLSFVILLLF